MNGLRKVKTYVTKKPRAVKTYVTKPPVKPRVRSIKVRRTR